MLLKFHIEEGRIIAIHIDVLLGGKGGKNSSSTSRGFFFPDDTNFPVTSCHDKYMIISTETVLIIFLKQLSKMQKL